MIGVGRNLADTEIYCDEMIKPNTSKMKSTEAKAGRSYRETKKLVVVK